MLLHNQIQQINHIASLLHRCTASAILSWLFELKALGLEDLVAPLSRQYSCMEISKQRVLDNIHKAFLIGYNKFLNFHNDHKDNLNNVWKEFMHLTMTMYSIT